MLALLAVVALASGNGNPSGEETGSGPTRSFWDYLYTGAVLLVVLAIVVVAVLAAMARGRGFATKRPKHTLYPIFALLALMGLVVFLLNQLEPGDQGRPRMRLPPLLGGSSAARADAERKRYDPEFRWEAALVVLGIGAAAAIVVVVRARRRPSEGDEAVLVEELATMLDETLDDLRAEPDPRRAVIAAYARMERALAANDLPRRRSEAPLEFLDRASRELHVRLPAARRLLFELTHLFERAKFSPHAIDADMKDDAIATLSGLRDELRGGSS